MKLAIVMAVPALALCLSACAPSSVQTDYESVPRLARPDTILIYDFAVSPDEVQLDSGLVGKVEAKESGKSRTEQELEVGHKVAGIISEQLVTEINALGLPARRAFGAPRSFVNTMVVEGQIASINEGNQAERVAIGLGAGASDVECRVQLYTTNPGGLEVVETFTTSMKSGYMPGMAETMGAGAIGGHLAVSVAAGAGLHTISEKLSGDVDAEARRTAKAIAKQLGATSRCRAGCRRRSERGHARSMLRFARPAASRSRCVSRLRARGKGAPPASQARRRLPERTVAWAASSCARIHCARGEHANRRAAAARARVRARARRRIRRRAEQAARESRELALVDRVPAEQLPGRSRSPRGSALELEPELPAVMPVAIDEDWNLITRPVITAFNSVPHPRENVYAARLDALADVRGQRADGAGLTEPEASGKLAARSGARR